LDELQTLLADSLAAGPSGRAAVHSVGQEESSTAAGEGDVWAGRAVARTQLLQQVVAEPNAVPHASSVNQIMSLLTPEGDESSVASLPLPASAGPLDPTAVLEGYLQVGCMVLHPQTLFFSAHLFSTNYTHSIHSSIVARTLLVHNLNAECFRYESLQFSRQQVVSAYT
jgi:hypothetical protein